MEKVRIKQASLLLKSPIELDVLELQSGHQCAACSYKLSEEASEVFDGLPELGDFVALNVKMSLVYIAGYVTRKDHTKSDYDLFGHTTFHYKKYGDYAQALDCGGLNVPTDHACQWAFFCFIMFHAVKINVCRKSLCNVFKLISDFYDFSMKDRHCTVLSNIFLNKFCLKTTPRSGKEPALKILKLS